MFKAEKPYISERKYLKFFKGFYFMLNFLQNLDFEENKKYLSFMGSNIDFFSLLMLSWNLGRKYFIVLKNWGIFFAFEVFLSLVTKACYPFLRLSKLIWWYKHKHVQSEFVRSKCFVQGLNSILYNYYIKKILNSVEILD